MRRLMLGLIAMATLVMARPELYNEKEDFQYSRSSTDEGSKSGFYDAQRGNMGGNFEKAHNMDSLAQHQMGGLIQQVQGELGGGAQTRTGSVFTAANSRGVYGSGRYDLSNVAGRNFQEGAKYGDSQLQSASNSAYSQSSSQHNARYGTEGGNYMNSGYKGYQASNLQGAQRLYDGNQYEQGTQVGQSSRQHSQSGYEGRTAYEQLNTNHLTTQNEDANMHHRLISTVPVKIIVRPGQRIAIPIATQTHTGSRIASYYDQNTANSDAELLSTSDQQESYKPSNNAKQYESSYSYRKEWEKHDARPSVAPTIEPKKSELHEDSYLQRGTGSQYSARGHEQNADFNSAFSQSQHQSAARHHSAASSNSNLNAFSQVGSDYRLNSHAATANLVGPVSSKPKSYESSYSYHKSWERQGDPYVIQQASNGAVEGQTSDRLTDASASQAGYSSHSYGASQTQNQQRYSHSKCNYECDPSHSRAARSADHAQHEQQQSENLEDLSQQTQTQWDLSQLGQQTQDTWGQTENLEQQVQNKENLEDFGQQTQDTWGQTGQQSQSKWENFENGQQTQNTFDNLEDLGQQTQTKWDTDSVSQQSQSQTVIKEELGQQTQNKAEQLEDLGQQTQNKWNEDMTGQQTQSNLEAFGQSQTNQQQDSWNQQTSTKDLEVIEQQTQDTFDKQEHVNSEGFQQNQASNDKNNFNWDKLDKHEETQKTDDTQKVSDYNEGQTSVQQSFQPDDMAQRTQGSWDVTRDEGQLIHKNTETQETSVNGFNEQIHSENTGSVTGLWGKLDTLDGDYVQSNMNNENSYFSQSSSSQHTSKDWHQEQSYNHTNSETASTFNNYYSNVSSATAQANEEKSSLGKTTNEQIDIKDLTTTNQITQKESELINNDIKNVTTTEKVESIDKFRPADIGRGDIGPEEPMVDESDTDKNSKETNNLTTNKIITLENKNQESPQEFDVSKQESVFNNVAQESNFYDNPFEQSDSAKTNTEQVEEVPQNVQKQIEQHMKTESTDQQTTQELEVFDQNSFSEQSKDIGQQTQHFFDTMKTFETQNQNSNQDNNKDIVSNLNQQNQQSDQQVNWNQESQNTEQQFVSDFSQQNQAPVQSFEQQFVDFGQQHETSVFESQQMDLVPETVDVDQSQVRQVPEEKAGQFKSNDEQQSIEEMIVPKRYNPDYHTMGIAEEKQHEQNVQNIEIEPEPVEVVTEKPGFWKSVGNKFVSVKSQVASWFGS